jgi:hypothetical protein
MNYIEAGWGSTEHTLLSRLIAMKESVEAAKRAYGDESKLPIVESDLSEPAAEEAQLGVEYSIVRLVNFPNSKMGDPPL